MWLVTREASEGQALVDALKARGRRAVCVPAIRREALPWPTELDAAARAAQGPLWWFLTSPFVARLALERFIAGGIERARTLRIAALSPATADIIAAAQVTVDVAARGGAEALAEACAAAGVDGVVLYPTSDAGLAQEEQTRAVQILARTAAVARAAVYTTYADPRLDDNLRLLERKGAARYHAVLFSPSAARALHAGLVRTCVPGPATVVTVGASTARAWPKASMLAPAGVDIVDFLCSVDNA
jgi:uroporphyrinogen-III synthase